MKGKRQDDLTAVALVRHLGIQLTEKANLAFCAEPEDVTHFELLRGSNESKPARPINPLVQGRFDGWLAATAPDAPAFEPCGNDLAVVDHEAVARLQQIRQIANAAVLEFRQLAWPDHEQARDVTRNLRP